MTTPTAAPIRRWIGLDVHKHYLIAVGVDQDKRVVFGPQRVQYPQLAAWIAKHLTPQDDVVLEMTTNAYQLHDDLLPHVGSVTVVHPPHVALDRARPSQDRPQGRPGPRRNCTRRASCPASGCRPSRCASLRGAHRPTRQDEQARHTGQEPAAIPPASLPHPAARGAGAVRTRRAGVVAAVAVDALEKVRVQCDLDTLAFAKGQVTRLDKAIAEQAAQRRARAAADPTAGDWVVKRADPARRDWRHRPLPDGPPVGRLCGHGHARA